MEKRKNIKKAIIIGNIGLGGTCINTMLYAGQTVRLRTNHEEHKGKHFKVIEVLDDLIKVEWQKRIYFFYCTELEVVKSSI